MQLLAEEPELPLEAVGRVAADLADTQHFEGTQQQVAVDPDQMAPPPAVVRGRTAGQAVGVQNVAEVAAQTAVVLGRTVGRMDQIAVVPGQTAVAPDQTVEMDQTAVVERDRTAVAETGQNVEAALGQTAAETGQTVEPVLGRTAAEASQTAVAAAMGQTVDAPGQNAADVLGQNVGEVDVAVLTARTADLGCTRALGCTEVRHGVVEGDRTEHLA